MEPFNYIQSFIIKPAAVNNASQVFVTSVDLYFKNKPGDVNNTSGIAFPGVTVYLCPFNGENPNPEEQLQDISATVDHPAIPIVADASIPTKFSFSTPIVLKTNTYYGIVVVFDDDDYELFMGVQDEIILNTTRKFSGSTGEGDGKLYIQGSGSDLDSETSMKPLSNRDLKFELRVAKFTANTIVAELCNDDYEFFTCNNMSTSSKFKGGEIVYTNFGLVANSTVNTFFSRVGTVASIVANSYIVGTNTSFTTDYSEGDYLVITNTSNTSQQDIVQIKSIADNTFIELENPARFSNTNWHNKVIIGEVSQRDYIKQTLYLNNSTAANSSIRFHTNSVNYFTISNPGGSYSNNDTVRVSNGTVNAAAVLVTNATGNVVAIRLVSAGGGFPNSTHSVVTITTSTGSSANLTPVINTPLKGAISGATADLKSIDNINLEVLDPEISFISSSISSCTVTYAVSNSTGYIQSFRSADLTTPIDLQYPAAIFSRSNELNTSTNLYNSDKSSLMRVAIGVNNPNVNNAPTFFSPYLYDDNLEVFGFTNKIDSTSANTDSEIGRGSMQSKHITTKITFANNSFAEDIRVYINAYKPANTQILVYAKIHNSQDSEPYDDKSWSPLSLISGQNLLSASRNKQDTKEYVYGFPQFPPSSFTCNTNATTQLSNTVVLTTTNLTSNLAANDLVKIYNPLFSTTNYIVSPVASVNSTAVVIQNAISNSGLVGNSLKIDKLKFKNVAYNNVLNDNVVRYFTTSMSPIDGYDSMSIKMVFLADSTDIVPEVDDIRVIAVSA